MTLPRSTRKAVLKGVITGCNCNIRCFCLSCNGSKVVSAYYFEQHTGSTKKHPADYIYLGNDNSLRDMLQASDRSPLEAVEKTICSSIDPVVKRSCVNCLNCNELVLSSSQTENILCQGCLGSKQRLAASYTCNSSSSANSPVPNIFHEIPMALSPVFSFGRGAHCAEADLGGARFSGVRPRVPICLGLFKVTSLRLRVQLQILLIVQNIFPEYSIIHLS